MYFGIFLQGGVAGFLGVFRKHKVVTSSGPYLNHSWTTAMNIETKLKVIASATAATILDFCHNHAGHL